MRLHANDTHRPQPRHGGDDEVYTLHRCAVDAHSPHGGGVHPTPLRGRRACVYTFTLGMSLPLYLRYLSTFGIPDGLYLYLGYLGVSVPEVPSEEGKHLRRSPLHMMDRGNTQAGRMVVSLHRFTCVI